MAAEHHNDMQCSEFDALLSEALDQTLDRTESGSFPGAREDLSDVRAVACGS